MNKFWIAVVIVLAAANILIFWPGSLFFLNDDLIHLPLTDAGTFFQTNSVRPVHELLVKTELMLWGKKAWAFHLTALILHVIVCMQVFELGMVLQTTWWGLDKQKALYVSFLSVVLFLAYPQHAEALGWILGRAPVLSAVFLLPAIRLFFARNINWYVTLTAALCFAIALFTYEQGVLLPLVLFWSAFKNSSTTPSKAKKVYSVTLLGVSMVYIIVRKLVTAEIVGEYEGKNFTGLNVPALTANLFRFITRLCVNPATPSVYVAQCIGLLVIIFVTYILLRKYITKFEKAYSFSILLISILIFPVLSLGISTRSYESGRYLYLPSLFFVMALSFFAVTTYYQSKAARIYLIVLVCGIIFYWSWGKYTSSKYYRDASLYAKHVDGRVSSHFAASSDTLYIDTLHTTIHQLPVFRVGFKEGMKWMHNNVDTNKIVIRHYINPGL